MKKLATLFALAVVGSLTAILLTSFPANAAPGLCRVDHPVEGGYVEVTGFGHYHGWSVFRLEPPGILHEVKYWDRGGFPNHFYFETKIYNVDAIIALLVNDPNWDSRFVTFYAKCESL